MYLIQQISQYKPPYQVETCQVEKCPPCSGSCSGPFGWALSLVPLEGGTWTEGRPGDFGSQSCFLIVSWSNWWGKIITIMHLTENYCSKSSRVWSFCFDPTGFSFSVFFMCLLPFQSRSFCWSDNVAGAVQHRLRWLQKTYVVTFMKGLSHIVPPFAIGKHPLKMYKQNKTNQNKTKQNKQTKQTKQ